MDPTTKGGPYISLASRPFNDASLDMGRPPQTSRAYSRTGRAALTAGTLGTVGNDVAREDVKRYVEVSDAHRDNTNVVTQALPPIRGSRQEWEEYVSTYAVSPTDHDPKPWYGEAERSRQSRLRRWQTIR